MEDISEEESNEPHPRLKKFIREKQRLIKLRALIQEEIDDYNRILGPMQASQFIRRCQYRTVFSCVEAHISHAKASALLFFASESDLFTHAEKLTLEEKKSVIDEKGRIVERASKIRLKTNVQMAVRSMAKSVNRSIEADFSNEGGGAFLRSIKVRDRIMHPKGPESWIISEEDSVDLIKGWLWFTKTLNDVISRID